MADRNNLEKSIGGKSRNGGMHLAMLACCAVMVLPVAAVFFSDTGFGLDGLSLSTLAPLLLCVGGHFVVHKIMGKSCQGNENATQAQDFSVKEYHAPSHVTESRVPVVKRR